MKFVFKLFADLFAGLVGKLMFAANFVICLFVFDWDKFFRYLETPARINCHIKPRSSVDICLTGIHSFIFEPILYVFVAFFSLLVYPSIAVTEIVLDILKVQFPLWCIETFDILYVPIFAVINSIYWLFLGDMIEIAHSAYLRNKTVQKPLSILPDKEKNS